MTWTQSYDPFGGIFLSALVAALPVVVLLGLLAFTKVSAHMAAVWGLLSAVGIAIAAYGMPLPLALGAAGNGAAYGLFPIGWIVLGAIFVYDITVSTGQFEILKGSIASLSSDRRLQLLLIAFSFGAFIEGAAGFGTPVAISAAMLIGLGFKPLQAAALALIGNTAPVAFGALGTPIIALARVTALPIEDLSAMVGRQLPLFSLIVPFWLVWAMAGWKSMREVWPACLVSGATFGLFQFLVSNYHGPWLVDIIAAIVSILSLVALLKVWHPKTTWRFDHDEAAKPAALNATSVEVARAWMPWVLLSVLVFIWGLPSVKAWFDGFSAVRWPVPYLHQNVFRAPPVVPTPRAEDAIFVLNWLSATGTSLLLTGIIAGTLLGVGPAKLARIFAHSLYRVRWSLLTIAAMMALGFTTRYGGLDASMGFAFASTGPLFPFFSPLLGWLGVALTGSDTSSNVLFGNLQQITAERLGVSPILAAASNSSGGVMGKMIDAQSIVVASVATGQQGEEGAILRQVFWHSLALAGLVGVLVLLQAYVFPGIVPE
jgi:lactate permease